MPCRDYGIDYDHGRSMSSIAEIKLLKMRCDLLARIACKAMYALEGKTDINDLLKDTEVAVWYHEHKKEDQKRLKQEEKEKERKLHEEELRKQALAKLTPEEKIAFGFFQKRSKR
jgi:hypothetical protein